MYKDSIISYQRTTAPLASPNIRRDHNNLGIDLKEASVKAAVTELETSTVRATRESSYHHCALGHSGRELSAALMLSFTRRLLAMSLDCCAPRTSKSQHDMRQGFGHAG
jgi:hypothetical protein